MKAVIINQNDYVVNSGNKFIKRFNSPIELNNSNEMSLHSLDIYLSWQNINKLQYNNNFFQYKWLNGLTFDVSITDGGFDSISELNAFFYKIQDSNSHYLTNDKGIRVYYMNFIENAVSYRIQLNVNAVEKVLPAGWTKPSGNTWSLPTGTNKTPQVIINKVDSNFCSLIGFETGIYPAVIQSSSYSVLGQNVPIFQPVSSIIVRCNCVNSNSGSGVSDLIFVFSPQSSYGSMLSLRPATELWLPCVANSYSELVLTFYDQNYMPMKILDSQLLAVLLIR